MAGQNMQVVLKRSKFGVSQLEFFLQMRVYAHIESKHHIYDKYEVNRHTS